MKGDGAPPEPAGEPPQMHWLVRVPLASVLPSGLNATENAAPCGPPRVAVQVCRGLSPGYPR